MIMNAAGTLNFDLLKFDYDAIVTKSVTVKKREGNPTPRSRRLENGFINNVGIRNPGLEDFSLDDWDIGLPIVVSVWGYQAWEYEKVCSALKDDKRVIAFELNLSCPNVLTHVDVIGVLKWCRSAVDQDIFVKFSVLNSFHDLVNAKNYGADALTLINTIPALDIDDNGVIIEGGLSGTQIKPIALRSVYDAVRYVDIPVIGCGGISNEKDIEDFKRVGAEHVQIGTANF
jgi:dihydroorotate dehydrogenase (NAD+) catalytic subunit